MRSLHTALVILGSIILANSATAGEGAPFPPRHPSTPRFASVAAELEKPDSRLRDPEALLGTLSPLFRSHYALVYDSRSLQRATFADPRALLFGVDARSVVAFNGSNVVEWMEYDEASDRFHFHEIAFDPAGKRPARVHRDDPKCLNCHGNPPRPRWDVYFYWPGVYGSEDDQHTFYPETHARDTREARAYDAFQARRRAERAKGVGRYRFLEDLKPSYDSEYPRPNTQLSSLLHTMNLRSVARDLRRNPQLAAWRYALSAQFMKDCQNLPGFFPREAQPRIDRVIDALAKDVYRTNRAMTDAKVKRNLRLLGVIATDRAIGIEQEPREKHDYYDRNTAGLRFLLEGFFDYQVSDWSMELGPRSYGFDINGDIDGLHEPLHEFFFTDPEDRRLVTSTGYYWSCETFAARHRAVMPAAPLEKALRKLEARLGLK